MTAAIRAFLFGALAVCLPTTRAAVPVPGRPAVESVDFERHVIGVFSKAGCNAGSCHGSFQGKNGFRLSLFGFDAKLDLASLTRESGGRRVNPLAPDQSLLLRKAAGRMPHDGGVRFAVDSWQYAILRDWIASGTKWDPGRGDVRELWLDTPTFTVVAKATHRPLCVTAVFADGAEEVVTPFCEFKLSDDMVADVTEAGVVTARKPGETALIVSYRGAVASTRILVPAERPATLSFPNDVPANVIDGEVLAKLRLLEMVPSPLAGDAEFLRRVTIDTIGTLPAPDEVRQFLSDPSPNKRSRKIDELLVHPLHAAVWATRLSDMTGNNPDLMVGVPGPLRPRFAQMWHDWFRRRFADNMPYDQIVRGVICATSREGAEAKEWVDAQVALDEQAQKGFGGDYSKRDTLDLFWKQQNMTLEARGERVAAAFLGVRLECAQCHKHPYDRWTQSDYRSFANVFAQVQVGASPEARELVNRVNAERKDQAAKNNQALQLREVYLAAAPARPGRPKLMISPRALRDPETSQPATPRALGGPPIAPDTPTDDCREKLLTWMTRSDNPTFARNFVNRVWAHYFGLGLVEPVDDFSAANPPSNPKLLDALARTFIADQFDVRAIERLILNSRTYQATSLTNVSNRLDRANFSRSYVRPLMAETVVDVLNAALGVKEALGNDGPAGSHLIEVGSSRLTNGGLAYAMRIFGRPARTSACDCDRSTEIVLPQTLYRMSDPTVMQKLSSPAGRVMTYAKSKLSDAEIIDELFLATLSRFPTDAERSAARASFGNGAKRTAWIQDTMWALINTREFILNH